ncbi:MAG: GPP34 family phosphoprotein [Eubacteriaceae bacterium]|nr:GPP34 family phosphoprotein [Eubacteriaceae bacterium]
MQELSLAQEFYLCSFNEKGNIPALKSVEVSVCLLAGAIIELVQEGYLSISENSQISISKQWDGQLPYLKPLYDKIASFSKPKDITGIMEAFELGLSQKPFTELMSAIGSNLAASGHALELSKQSMRKEKITYAPRPEAVTRVIEKVRAEFLEDGIMEEETMHLASLLDKSTLIGDYFSKVETAALKKRLKEVRASEEYAFVNAFLEITESAVAVFIAVVAATIAT